MKYLSELNKFTHFTLALLFMFLMTSFGWSQNPPTLYHQYNEVTQMYDFQVEHLNPRDLVYFRFSDGYHMPVLAKKLGPNEEEAVANISRQFANSGSYSVVAYVGRKGGSLGKAQGSSNIVVGSGNTGATPVYLDANQNIGMNTSWRLFNNDTMQIISHQDITAPNFDTPTDPWFFLNVTLKRDAGTPFDYAEVYFPDNLFNVEQVIVEGNSTTLSLGETNTTVASGSDFCSSVSYPSSGKIKVDVQSTYYGEVNMYILMRNETTLVPYEEVNFGAYVFQTGDSVPLDEINITKRVALDPHDPNQLTAYNDIVCANEPEGEPLTYVVEFQNYGSGFAENVIINLEIDEDILDVNTVNINGMSHPGVVVTNDPGMLSFEFLNIDLPGTQQEYPQVYDEFETQGGIEFTIELQPCIVGGIEIEVYELFTFGNVEFYGGPIADIQSSYEQTPLNGIVQKVVFGDGCGEPRESCEGEEKQEMEAFWSDIVNQKNDFSEGLTLSVAPTLFNNRIKVQTNPSEENTVISTTLMDLTGRIWVSKNTMPQSIDFHEEILETTEIPAGMYILQVSQGTERQSQKVIKH